MTPTELRAALVALVRASGALPTSGRIEAESVAVPAVTDRAVAMVQVLSDVRRGRGSPVEAWTVAADGSQALAHYVYRRAMVAVLFVGARGGGCGRGARGLAPRRRARTGPAAGTSPSGKVRVDGFHRIRGALAGGNATGCGSKSAIPGHAPAPWTRRRWRG